MSVETHSQPDAGWLATTHQSIGLSKNQQHFALYFKFSHPPTFFYIYKIKPLTGRYTQVNLNCLVNGKCGGKLLRAGY